MGDTEYTDIQQHEGNRAGIVVSVRLKPDEAQLLRALAERDRRTLSDTLRIALHAFSQQPPPDSFVPGAEQTFTRGGVFVEAPGELMLT